MGKESNTIIGILAGTVIGATLGILFAPDKGIITRQKIADEAQLQKDRLAHTATDLKDRVTSTVVNHKDTFDNQLETIVSDVSYKADDVISTLEKKLAILKAKNKNLQKTS
ncbi:YtxH domain-containing protein [Psychroserpens burtonensis]|uniref:YtxH domain-containing protein n=1 Tax=Psychroserpens burtonensis TaxID=49278 RepID=A0A5C7BFI3_9FLAO|nr:YtxH domain-containing protein [Psychroserpens burtonensis]TXE19955.1 YtxH domain-containing protein [Psychroserpens burtonensis]